MTFLDLSAAFDTVDLLVLLNRLRAFFGLDGLVLRWLQVLQPFLADRIQSVRSGATTSQATPVACGVPQGSVLGPLLFTLYTAELADLARYHGLRLHSYADDIQLYGFCNPSKKLSLIHI